jgi:hypothetical protein
MKQLSVIVFTLLFLLSCKQGGTSIEKPKDCLSEVEMIALLKDLHLAQAHIMLLNPVGDSLKNSYLREYAKVFAIHHTNTVQFRNSLKYYCSDPEKFDQVYNKIIVDMNQLDLKND